MVVERRLVRFFSSISARTSYYRHRDTSLRLSVFHPLEDARRALYLALTSEEYERAFRVGQESILTRRFRPSTFLVLFCVSRLRVGRSRDFISFTLITKSVDDIVVLPSPSFSLLVPDSFGSARMYIESRERFVCALRALVLSLHLRPSFPSYDSLHATGPQRANICKSRSFAVVKSCAGQIQISFMSEEGS